MLRKNITTILICLFYFLQSKAQVDKKGVVVIMAMESSLGDGGFSKRTDTFLVRDNFILEPVRIRYENLETNLKTGITREISAGQRLQSYNLTNYLDMIGMTFDVNKEISAKTIEPYRVIDGNKKGTHFINEPYLINGLDVSDFTKVQDTIINGKRCILINTIKTAPKNAHRQLRGKTFQIRIAIDPSKKEYAFPFISKKIVEHFGGGAMINVVGTISDGTKTKVSYSYQPFTSKETDLFSYYENLYNSNLTVLDKLRKKKD